MKHCRTIIVISILISQISGQNSRGECPRSHPFAFNNSKSCCKYGIFNDFFYETDYDDSEDYCCFSNNGTFCCLNDSVACPTGSNCKDCKFQFIDSTKINRPGHNIRVY